MKMGSNKNEGQLTHLTVCFRGQWFYGVGLRFSWADQWRRREMSTGYDWLNAPVTQ